jgi:purine-binding chemotaxis protein CheW
MVDLVKLRKKAKAKKDEEAAAQAPAAADSSAALPPADAGDDRQSGHSAAAPAEAPAVTDAAPAVPRGTRREMAEQETRRALSEAEQKLEEYKRELGVSRIAPGEQAVAEERPDDDNIVEMLTFTLAGETYAVPIENIVEIVEPRKTTRVPNADRDVVGIISLRGTIVTIIDVRGKLGHGHADFGTEARVVVVDRGGEMSGFLVDRVWRVVKIAPAALAPAPIASASEQSEYVRSVFQAGNGLAIVLDLEKILDAQVNPTWN